MSNIQNIDKYSKVENSREKIDTLKYENQIFENYVKNNRSSSISFIDSKR